ncbi:MAG: HD domain-containing phosphohydrolase [Candidatus Manganitrophaceae bacterium]
MIPMNSHEDLLGELNKGGSLSQKLRSVHSVLKKRHDFIDRVAVAVYDSKTDLLKTFIHSGGDGNPLVRYEAKLTEVGSLRAILESGRPRVINDLAIFAQGTHEHTRRIAGAGFGSSYTLPVYFNGLFLGFLFLDSYQKEVFQAEVLDDLDLFGHLISQMIANELAAIRMMISTVQAARHIAAYRDRETGGHIDRVSHYARLIARKLAPKYRFDDEYIELIFLFAPLHDIGKVGIPDVVLKKGGELTPQECEVMKGHTIQGRRIIDTLLRDFGLDTYQNVDMLRNIAEYHHEAVDGSGYPHGIEGESIPIEARIIAVADIFDALTSRRRYKVAWSLEEAFAMLRRLSGFKLDPDCVEALLQNREAVTEIQARFKEE